MIDEGFCQNYISIKAILLWFECSVIYSCCIKMEFVSWTSLILNTSFLQSILSTTCVTRTICDLFFSIYLMIVRLVLVRMLSQIFKTLVALTWDNFTVPHLSQGELGLTVHAITSNEILHSFWWANVLVYYLLVKL